MHVQGWERSIYMNTHKRMDSHTLIAGCGYVGSELGRILGENGGHPYGLRRNVGALPAGIVPVAADLGSPGQLPEVPELDALVYCASAGGRTPDAYRLAYVDGVSRLADALGGRTRRLERAVFVSSTAVWGKQAEGELDETTTAVPDGFSGELLLEGEARFRECFANAVVIRLSGIYGPGRTRMISQVASGGPFESPAEAIGNRIHRDDSARAIAHLLAHDSPEALYVGVDRGAVPLGEVRGFIAERLGLDPAPFLPTQPWRGKKLRSHRLTASGFDFTFASYRDGYPAIVDAYMSARA
jgi:nucleoside-diphosphate-sugar epimerase